MGAKDEAYQFLKGLELELNQVLPAPGAMRLAMIGLAAQTGAHNIRENVFLYFILPFINSFMKTVPGFGAEEARASTLCEYHSKVPHLASGNSFRKAGHPFKKQLRLSADEIIEGWHRDRGEVPQNQAYPDLAFRSPFPHKIVFDAKYFLEPSASAANRALVEGAYEVMFYRGLPTGPTDGHEAGWDYEYGCLLAYDATDDGYLKCAWDEVIAKADFWSGANIFVMILRGNCVN